MAANPGYGFSMNDVLEKILGCNSKLAVERMKIVDNIYNANLDLSSAQRDKLFASSKNVYVIIRRKSPREIFNERYFIKVFQSSKGNFLVYRSQ